ncbi:11S globulin subunit beta [Artemisia annua]|uniref:11S globulin subunit beta n=1 Tax=Artemisia annua TaxID=35608 RepID=A0A2U1PCI2_ARTAN|nr:11S globulin subunit beta [Artemisia annua]
MATKASLLILRNIEALEPYDVVQAEAGVTEFWDANDQQFQCAGVDFIRHRIQPGGLLLPSYVNTPILSFIERGSAVHGVILPGCPETYESSEVQQQQITGQGQRRGQGERGGQQSVQTDRHQKVENVYKGDVVAIPAGAAHWIYNDGQEELVAVVFFDAQNKDNQLDEVQRRFYLAGNPGAQSQQQQGRQSQPWRQQGQGQGQGQILLGWKPWSSKPTATRPQQEQGQGRRQSQSQHETGNIFNGFDVEFIAEAFNVDTQTAEKLQGQNDQRGHIVNVGQGLQIIRPQQSQQQQQQRQPQRQSRRGGGYGSNGLEETICSMKLKENIENPSHADFVNPQAGQISNLNSFKFPILQQLQLSLERGELNQNAIQTPHWTINAHNLVYVTDGSMRIQIVNNEGNSVFDDELREGQVVVIPQNYAVIKRAGQQGCRWVSFKTNDNAMISNLAGRVSAIRSMPVHVVANSYQMSIEDAQRLKFSQEQTVLLAPSSSSQGRKRSQGGLRADA